MSAAPRGRLLIDAGTLLHPLYGDGELLRELAAANRGIAMVSSLAPSAEVAERVGIGGMRYRSGDSAQARTRHVLSQLDPSAFDSIVLCAWWANEDECRAWTSRTGVPVERFALLDPVAPAHLSRGLLGASLSAQEALF